jgi:monoterpene epsilon-lactone hydrolase
MKEYISILIIMLGLGTGCDRNQDFSYPYDYYIPETVSQEAQNELKSMSRRDRREWPASGDHAGWKSHWDYNEKAWLPFNDSVAELYNPTIIDTLMGGTPVLDIRPEGWTDNGKVLVYIHGGAYVLFSAYSTLMGSVPVADRLATRVISVNYTNPPAAKSAEILDQIIAVVQALVQAGYDLGNIGIYGDSAGGALTAGSILKMRDQGMGMPGAAVLISPWADITESGDTYETLKDADPILNYRYALGPASLAYADAELHRTPYVSPVYADYGQGFPPTLIQGGTKEIFLSNFVRLYQAMDQAGVQVKLDLYEGMWHVFQEINYDLPESEIAHRKMDLFFRQWLGSR